MIFRQLFDHQSSTYTYLLASRRGGEALIIDPVIEHVERYVQLVNELDLRLVKALDTHIHADHISGLAQLRERTQCATVMGMHSKADVLAIRLRDGDHIDIDGHRLDVVYTPGHTDDSYSFYYEDRVFTGDTLLIRGTGRTDFQNGSAEDQYDSIFSRLFKLPDETLVYPAHDYQGETVSTIAEERAFNPRLQVASKSEYVELMANLNLAHPKMMDVAVPANLSPGLDQRALRKTGLVFDDTSTSFDMRSDAYLVVQIRSGNEQPGYQEMPAALNVMYTALEAELQPEQTLFEKIQEAGKPVVFCCEYGELSALAAKHAQAVGLKNVTFLAGGLATRYQQTQA